MAENMNQAGRPLRVLTRILSVERPGFVPFFPAKAWWHALSTAAAAILAIYLAFALELANPGSAAVTVLIVSSPLPGMIFSKGVWRLIGTMIGLVASVLMIGFLVQSPVAFLLALAAWLGLCTFVSSLLRNFQAYAAVLAGYTISLVALPAIGNPGQIFQLATGRLAVVVLGILCIAAVKSLFVLRIGHWRLRPALETALTASAAFAAQALDLAPGLPERRRAVATQLAALDPLIVAAANESAESAQQAPAARLFVTILLNIIALAWSVRDALASLPEDGAVAQAITPLRQQVRDVLSGISAIPHFIGPAMAETLQAARAAAAAQSAALAASPGPDILDTLALATRLEDLLAQLDRARGQLAAIERGQTGRATAPVSYHRDAGEAAINGLRAAIATLLGGAFWIVTAWPSGATMLAGLLPVCALLGATERPDRASLGFTRGLALSAFVAFLCTAFILPGIDGFGLLALVVGPILVIGCLCATLPAHTGSSTAFLIFFVTLLGLGNPMHYDVVAFFNSAIAMVSGAAFAVLVFRILLPANPARAIRRLIFRLIQDAPLTRPASPAWDSMMQDRLARLGTRLAASPDRAAVMEGGIAAIHIGREMGRISRRLADIPVPEAQTALSRLADLGVAPQEAAGIAETAARDVSADARTEAETPARDAKFRIAAGLHEVALLLRRHDAFFTRRLPQEVA